MSRLDGLYRRMLITRFFEKGWGKPQNLERLFEFRKVISNRNECFRLVPKDYKVEITKTENHSDCTILEGQFQTPFEYYLPGIVPKKAQTAHFQVVLPKVWKDENHKPVCIHLAGTGDHFFWRRRNLIAKPLLREANIGAIILENPFYGTRKPEDQVRSNLHNVSDIFVMGGCLVLECLVLLHWCERNGFGPLGITGLSMGGHMASLAATNWPKPLVLVPCLSWSTAAAVFTTGVMSQSINWDMLETQYFSDGNFCEKLSKMVTVVDDAFVAGQAFIRNFNESMEELKNDISDSRKDDKSKNKDENCYLTVPRNQKIIQLDKQNSLHLSSNLHSKLMSENKFELSNTEVNELNDKIKTVQDKIKQEKLLQKFIRKPTLISTDVIVNEIKSNKKQSITHNISKKEKSKNIWNMTNLMQYLLPTSTSPTGLESIDTTKTNWWEREALQFMRGVMDECTHLKNFSVPFDTSLAIAVCAKDDAYVPRKGCSSLEEIWPGVEVRYLDAGHVSAYVLHQKLFRSTIIEAFERAKNKREEGNTSASDEELKPRFSYQELKDRYEKYQSG